jgi:hypothetical protein
VREAATHVAAATAGELIHTRKMRNANDVPLSNSSTEDSMEKAKARAASSAIQPAARAIPGERACTTEPV